MVDQYDYYFFIKAGTNSLENRRGYNNERFTVLFITKFFHKGKNCCSTTAIGFHRVTNEEQYKMEYLIYELNKKNG